MQAHDLLWLHPGAWADGASLPDWAEPGWPVVVRRAPRAGRGLIPVGLRGRLRNQRHAAWVAPALVARCLTPETLAAERGWARYTDGGFACLDTLARIAPLLEQAGLTWGPTGAVGFALACGAAVLHPASDLDLLVRAVCPLGEAEIALLKSLKVHAGCRLDMQIDTGRGGFVLDEWLAGRRTVLLKTPDGPRLVSDPWQAQTDEDRS
ncbi:malonate decarboxylase holo-ACP synthase [Thauera sp. SDU_THAU2]|uniref:malonate decarboxylase holo-ACP synthase n=1 Tax=Thauera sp. SDU_THAU2 TaxID=3136633 RepID=UPI00311EC486